MSNTILDGGSIEVSGYQNCCGINIFYGFSSNTVHTQVPQMPTKGARTALESPGKGISLIALTHLQWESNPALLSYLQGIGYEPVVEDFHNSNTGNQITLFAKVHHPRAKGISAAWKKTKLLFNRGVKK